MGLAWQQGPLAPGAIGHFLVPGPLPERLDLGEHTTNHRDLGTTSWYTVQAGSQAKARAAWQHTELPGYADMLKGRVAFAWRAMDAFYEEDERIVGHAGDPYHRIDIRKTSRHLVVRHGDQVIATVEGQTFCPYKDVCGYYNVADARRAAWSYLDAWPEVGSEVGSVAGFISFDEAHL